MKKTLFLFFVFFFALATQSQAENFNFTSYYPAPTGNYESIHLTPQSALTTSNCPLGTIYANADDNSLPYYCGPTVGLPAFAPIAGPWTLSANDLYLTDTSTPENKKIGIGTITPIFKLTLENDGGILADGLASTSSDLPVAVSGAGTRLIWYPKKGAFRAGGVDADQWDDANIGISSMAMGSGNTAQTEGSSVWGGQNNTALDDEVAPSCVSGFEIIAGGKNNNASRGSQILGGSGNSAGCNSKVSGKNNSSLAYSTIGGGEGNTASTGSGYTTISGGAFNNINNTSSTISGGRDNIILAEESTIAGGHGNVIDEGCSYSTIAGGYSNSGYNVYSVVSGGKSNTASGAYSTVSGGDTNTADTQYSSISGGNNNIANCSGGYCTIGAGASNTASGDSSTVIGGNLNTASGDHSMVPGGANNIADGAYSLAAGRNMNISGNHSFLWGYSASVIGAITATDAMIIYSGSMGIRDTSPAALLEINGNSSADDYLNLTSTSAAIAGNILTIKNNGFVGVNQSNPLYPLHFGNGAYVSAAGNFVNASSREYKENIISLQSSDALAAFSKLVPVQYNYKNEPAHRYVGFIAEDVPNLVSTQGRQGVSSMDIAALLTKVVAHQQDILKEQKDETDKLLKEFEELKNKVQIKNRSTARLKSL